MAVAVAPIYPAFGCRINLPAETRIRTSNAETVVLASVLEAKYGEAAFLTGERYPWIGSVQVEQTLRGQTKMLHFQIGRTGSSAACDDGIPRPEVGDLWILYLATYKGEELVVQAYPSAIAISADPTLQIGGDVR